MRVAEAVKALRQRLGATQQGLGDQVGVSARIVRWWESGSHTPDPRFLARLAQVAHDARDDALAAVFSVELARALGLHDREVTLSLVDVPQSPGDDPVQAYLRAKASGPSRAALLISRHSPEEARYVCAFADALAAVRGEDEHARRRAKRALDALVKAMEAGRDNI